ncbi:hypothetical protein CTheo_4525 [Ceratobasidium theobromae]|uniref:Uncharacterized protein n=1 Tax=Ceratobasidium theobromae TaxID=1582974 RepID=A0A5N5QKK0_9AGAM|nr:hypothetical protein CTheo_4525 [Ceratobasidium theobromae]
MTYRMSGTTIGGGRRLPFQFGKQELTDDERIASHTDPQLAELSTIRIIFQYAKLIGYHENPPETPKMRGVVHEKAAKKAHGDAVGFGKPTTSPLQRWCQTEKLTHLGKFEFVFHYAPYAHEIVPKHLVEQRSPPKPEASARSSIARVKPEKSIKDQPRTPVLSCKRPHTPIDLANDSDDSDVIVLGDGEATPSGKTKGKRRRIEESPINSSLGRNLVHNDDVIDLASSDAD